MAYALIKGITLGLLLAISVGPIVFTVIKQSITNGKAGGLSFIAGISFSDVVLVVLSNLFTSFFDAVNAHKKLLSIGASLVLICIGIYFLLFKKPTVKDDGKVLSFRKRDLAKLFGAGFLYNVFNPGIIIFWLTTATTFADHPGNQRWVIFTLALIIALLADIAKVLLANKIRQRLTPKNIHRVDQVNGAILILFGIGIIFLQR
jgi:threonine/homoserine/homoserine lactone efflux protein